MRDTNLVNALREHADWWENGDMMNPLGGLEKDLAEAADRIEAQTKEIENLRAQLRHLEELAEADRDGRLVVLPFTSGRTLLSKDIDSPRLMKDVELAISYCSSCGIVFHMGYNVFCDLVKHGRITAVSEEAEKALEAMKDE